MTSIKVENLFGGYSGEPVLTDVSFTVEQGEFFGILGPNGSGKTTLLKMISGVLPFLKGSIFVGDRSIQSFSAKELAQVIAVLSQHSSQAFSYTVKETVALGRYAHKKGLFQTWSQKDEEVVQEVMQWTGIEKFQEQSLEFLSGGEKQRVFLAQALAQEPEILLLDEPTNHLDLSYQKDLLDLLHKWTREKGLTIISIFHDINLAGLYCDRILLLEDGKVIKNDTPKEVLTENTIQQVFKTKIEMHQHPKVPAPLMVLLPDDALENGGTEEVTEDHIGVFDDYILLQSPMMLKTMSSGVIGSGIGWYNTFINRYVDKSYHSRNYREELKRFVVEKGLDPSNTVGMMTAVKMENVQYKQYRDKDFSILVVVIAGVGNAVDVSRSVEHPFVYRPGTINTWIIVNGRLSEEAFIQSIITATEAKVKALAELQIPDQETGTIATGTSTDSILIAATQKGKYQEFAGTITPLGKLIGKGVYECTLEAIQKSLKRSPDL